MDGKQVGGVVKLGLLVVVCGLVIGFGVKKLKGFFQGDTLPKPSGTVAAATAQSLSTAAPIHASAIQDDKPAKLVAAGYYREGGRWAFELEGGGAVQQWVPDERGLPVECILGKFGASISYRLQDMTLREYHLTWAARPAALQAPVIQDNPAVVIAGRSDPYDPAPPRPVESEKPPPGVSQGAAMRGVRF